MNPYPRSVRVLIVPFTFASVLTWDACAVTVNPFVTGRAPRQALARPMLIWAPMGELVSFVCVRADHQWDTGASGRIHATGEALGWCPDATSADGEAHEWRACGALFAAAGPRPPPESGTGGAPAPPRAVPPRAPPTAPPPPPAPRGRAG